MNFPNFAQLSKFFSPKYVKTFFLFFLGLTFETFLIWLDFPNFPDELSEFCPTFLIFQPKICEDLFFLLFFLGLTFETFLIWLDFPNFPDELSEFGSTFLIFRMTFLILPNFPNFQDELSEFGSTFLIFAAQSEDLFFFRSHLRNFPNLAQLSKFSGRTFRILLNFPNFS